MSPVARIRAFCSLFAFALSACATIGSDGLGDVGLPSAGVGPFRRLRAGEVVGIAPFVLDGEGGYREPTALAVSSAGPEVVLFAEATGSGRDGTPVGPILVRTRALDGRSFRGSGGGPGRGTEVVLVPSRPWEEGEVRSPFVMRLRGEVVLFYSGKNGRIGLARGPSLDGPFVPSDSPVLDETGRAPWEVEPPRAPTAYVEGDRVHLFYAAGGFVGEAVADPGTLTFRRVDADPSTPELDPALSPSPTVDPKSLAPNEKPPFDEAGVGDPDVSVRETPAGRVHVRVLYTGTSSAGAKVVGFAARYGHAGKLTRQPLPVYAAKGKERAPSLLDLGERGYLYVTEPRSTDGREGIGAAFAPAASEPGPPAPSE